MEDIDDKMKDLGIKETVTEVLGSASLPSDGSELERRLKNVFRYDHANVNKAVAILKGVNWDKSMSKIHSDSNSEVSQPLAASIEDRQQQAIELLQAVDTRDAHKQFGDYFAKDKPKEAIEEYIKAGEMGYPNCYASAAAICISLRDMSRAHELTEKCKQNGGLSCFLQRFRNSAIDYCLGNEEDLGALKKFISSMFPWLNELLEMVKAIDEFDTENEDQENGLDCVFDFLSVLKEVEDELLEDVEDDQLKEIEDYTSQEIIRDTLAGWKKVFPVFYDILVTLAEKGHMTAMLKILKWYPKYDIKKTSHYLVKSIQEHGLQSWEVDEYQVQKMTLDEEAERWMEGFLGSDWRHLDRLDKRYEDKINEYTTVVNI